MTNARPPLPARAPSGRSALRASGFPTRALVVIAAVAGLSLSTAAAAHAQLELNPSLGLGKPAGEDSDNFGPDVGMAMSVGGRFHPNFALHLRVHLDRMNPDEPPATEVSMDMLRLQLHPSAHVVQDRIDFSLGPTFGLYHVAADADGPGALDAESSERGFSVGVRTTLLFVVSPDISVGPFFAFDRLMASKQCITFSSNEACDDDPDDDTGFWQLGVEASF